jgi:multidrug efflux pump subunit AcrB
MTTPSDHHWVSRIVEVFLRGNLSVLMIVVSMIAGGVALWLTPRQEDPQIVVPMADVLVSMPGASAEEVERQVSTRLERLLYQIDGVKYVYSMSSPGLAIVTVRFFVGEDREKSLVNLYNKIAMNTDIVPPGVTGWVVKPVEIDDVPIVNVTLWSERSSDFVLRRIAEQVEVALQSVSDTSRTEVVGGRARQIALYLDAEKLAAHQVTTLEVNRVLQGANINLPSGSFNRHNRDAIVESGPYFRDAHELESLVVGVFAGRPVYLRDVATIRDGPAESTNYTRIFFGAASLAGASGSSDGTKPEAPAKESGAKDHPAVTVAVAKRRGTNAVWVAEGIEKKLEELRRDLIPSDVHLLITRNYGETANEKVNELVRELGLAVLIVVGLVGLSLGWRESIIVVTAVPLTFALTLLVNYLAGYSINRVTLFALILSLGLVVDDPIVDVENVFRHLQMGRESPRKSVLSAVNEVRPPIIVATMVVIISFLPMFFITGMMGPYMRPMALNVPVAMLMSMVVSFTITPWMCYHVLKGVRGHGEAHFVLEQTWTYRVYHALITPFLNRRWMAWLLVAVMLFLLVVSSLLPLTGRVPLKMLPFDNKNEFQIVVDLPRGSTLETTDAVLHELADYVCRAAETTEVLTYAGVASPMDFNGMVRHYYLRQQPHQGDIRVKLASKEDREQQSHQITLRLRPGLEEIAKRRGANIKLVEVPPGPPVFATLVAEVYGQGEPAYGDLIAAAKQVRRVFESEPGVVDVDDTVEADQTKYEFVVDKEKASLNGVSTATIAATVQTALQGQRPGESGAAASATAVLHQPQELNPLNIVLRFTRPERSTTLDLGRISVKGGNGQLVQIGELGHFRAAVADHTIYHKNLRRVVYVFGDTAGLPPPEAVLSLQARLSKETLPPGTILDWRGEGEWKVTLNVFRDLGLAYGGAVLGIYILLVWQTGSYSMPLVRMISIPLTIIGIMPGFWLLNVLWNRPIGGYPDPVFFTATAMIGMIALAGIADRNAILLIDFIHHVLQRGDDLRRALIESGAVRFRPIFLTAGAAMLGAWPITLDPVFSGLAWSLIFGLVVSTAFTLILVPVVYWLLYERRPGHGLAVEEET